MTSQTPISDGLFTWPADRPQLIGACCAACGVTTFPRQSGCPRCAGQQMVDVLLPRTGSLWTFTTQEFLPKKPYAGSETAQEFIPFAVGYVQLGDQVRVETRLTEASVDRLKIGMPMELVVVPLAQAANGDQLVTFAFQPADVTGSEAA